MTKARIRDRLEELAEDCRRQAGIANRTAQFGHVQPEMVAERMRGRSEVFNQMARTIDGFRLAI